MILFPTSHDKIFKNLDFFCNNTINDYSSKRNFVFGPPHNNVSKLSPYIRRRFITEEQVLEKIYKKKSNFKIDKFVTQIFWRTYFRGWLESHPWVYEKYDKENENYNVPSKTGIKCFDSWTEELIKTGYLHNHARMWYASIWIFTLNRTWQSGANFFKNNLLDWCPASNTLGWRWVAGLHTVGKHYVAKEDNINFFTNFDFKFKNNLNENPSPIYNDYWNGESLNLTYEKNLLSKDLQNIGIVLNKNDMSFNIIFADLKLPYEGCIFKNYNENTFKNNIIKKFEQGLFNDVIEQNPNFCVKETFNDLLIWVKKKQIKNLILPFEHVGNKIFNNSIFLKKLNQDNINILFYIRDWDRYSFPHAKKGFFKFKKEIPNLLSINKLI